MIMITILRNIILVSLMYLWIKMRVIVNARLPARQRVSDRFLVVSLLPVNTAVWRQNWSQISCQGLALPSHLLQSEPPSRSWCMCANCRTQHSERTAHRKFNFVFEIRVFLCPINENDAKPASPNNLKRINNTIFFWKAFSQHDRIGWYYISEHTTNLYFFCTKKSIVVQ